MRAEKIIFMIFGIFGLLISCGLLLGGGTLFWATNTIKDNQGFFTTRTIEMDKNSYAIITGPADVDIDVGAGWGWDLGDLVTFKIEGSSNDAGNNIFIGIADERDVDAYLNDVEYDEMTNLHFYPDSVDYRNHSGSAEPGAPTSETFWSESVYGSGTQTLEWELQAGSHTLVLMNDDGSEGVDVDIEFGAKVPLVTGASAWIFGGGVLVLLVSILLIYVAARRQDPVPSSAPETPVPAASAAEESPPAEPVASSREESTPAEPVAAAAVGARTGSKLESNVGALLCYSLGWVTGIVFVLIDKEDKFIRFHAIQSIVVFGFLHIANIFFNWIPVIGDFFGAILGILTFILWVVLMVKAYQGEKFKIPIAGDIAEKQAE